MPAKNKNAWLLVVLLLLLIGGGGFAFLALVRDGSPEARDIEPGRRPAATRVEPGGSGVELSDPRSAATARDLGRSDPDLDTTVAWPLQVDLELLRAADALQAEEEAPLGAGANARLVGTITDVASKGVAATIEFEYGANAGRTIAADSQGRFGVADLYPGLSIVRVTGPGIPGSRRELTLRQRKETQFHIGYARPSFVQGRVLDERNEPIAGARVEMDGQVTQSDLEGRWFFGRMTSGPVLVLVDQPGKASYREVLNITAGFNVEPDKIAFRMKLGARLEVIVPDHLGAEGEAQLYFLPAQAQGLLRDHPWFRHNPTPVYPGGRVVLDDLPEERVQLWLFHAGAVASPEVTAVVLRAGATTTKTLRLEPSPMLDGVVRHDGRPVRGARVTLEAPDRTETMVNMFGQSPAFLETAVLPFMPPASRTTTTDDSGKFTLGAYEHVRGTRYIVATSADGALRAASIVKSGERDLTLDLEPAASGDSRLTLTLTDRFQGLPVEVRIDGAPRGAFVLSPRESLVVKGLKDGDWRAIVSWNGRRLLGPREFSLSGEAVLPVELPAEAIDGQSKDELERAGLR